MPRPAVLCLFAALLTAATDAPAQTPPPPTDDVPAWTATYADGRTIMTPVRSSWWSWTPVFPRVPGTDTARNGKPLMALAYSYVVDGRSLVFQIFLLYGSYSRDAGVLVETVRLTPDMAVRINRLREFNVEPVVLSLVRTRRASLQQPAVISASGQLEVRVEPSQDDQPLYRFTVINRGRQAIRVIQIKAYDGGREVMSGRQRGTRDLPWLAPGTTHTFNYSVGGKTGPDGSPMWNSWDRVEIPSVVWDDGLVEGDRSLVTSEQSGNVEKMAQIPRILEILKNFRGDDASLQAALDSLPQTAGGEVVKTELLKQWNGYRSEFDRNNFRSLQGWLETTARIFREWLERLRNLPSLP